MQTTRASESRPARCRVSSNHAFRRLVAVFGVVVAIAVRSVSSPIQLPFQDFLPSRLTVGLKTEPLGDGAVLAGLLGKLLLDDAVGGQHAVGLRLLSAGRLTKSSAKAFLVVFWCLLVEREANAWRPCS